VAKRRTARNGNGTQAVTVPLRRMTQAELDSFLEKAADILRGNVDHSEFRGYVFASLCFKRISDIFEESVRKQEMDLGEELAHDPVMQKKSLPFVVPADCMWEPLNGGAGLLRDLEALDASDRSEDVREGHRRLVGYVRSNVHRMNYPAYLARGWPIGSGAIESACKTVVGQRLKGSGMRWRERGTTALCQLRALYRSGPDVWSDYWRHHACP
jgi:hypothetical protein